MESHPAIGLQAIHLSYQKRTKYRRIYRLIPLRTLSNLFRVNSRWVDGDRVKMALSVRFECDEKCDVFVTQEFYRLQPNPTLSTSPELASVRAESC